MQETEAVLYSFLPRLSPLPKVGYDDKDDKFFCKRRGRGWSATARVATVPVSVPFLVPSKICKIFPVLGFLSVLNAPKFCYVTGQIPGTCENCSILSYLPIVACRRLQKVSYKQ